MKDIIDEKNLLSQGVTEEEKSSDEDNHLIELLLIINLLT